MPAGYDTGVIRRPAEKLLQYSAKPMQKLPMPKAAPAPGTETNDNFTPEPHMADKLAPGQIRT
jgi:hypothetical protein